MKKLLIIFLMIMVPWLLLAGRNADDQVSTNDTVMNVYIHDVIGNKTDVSNTGNLVGFGKRINAKVSTVLLGSIGSGAVITNIYLEVLATGAVITNVNGEVNATGAVTTNIYLEVVRNGAVITNLNIEIRRTGAVMTNTYNDGVRTGALVTNNADVLTNTYLESVRNGAVITNTYNDGVRTGALVTNNADVLTNTYNEAVRNGAVITNVYNDVVRAAALVTNNADVLTNTYNEVVRNGEVITNIFTTGETNFKLQNVPAADATRNINTRDVVGNKTDTHDGNSLYSHVIADNDHKVSKVYPTQFAGSNYTTVNTVWGLTNGELGGSGTNILVPASTITSDFEIHYVSVEALGGNNVYEIILYNKTTAVEIGRTRVTKNAAQDGTVNVPIQTPIQAANSEIGWQVASDGQLETITISIFYHTF